MSKTLNISILIFDEVEVLDFSGPFEVFSVTGRRDGIKPFHVTTISETGQPIHARNNLIVTPTHSFDTAPEADIILVPGGYGTRALLGNQAHLDWIKATADKATVTLSVCTGALLLASAGLLHGLAATTHHLAFDELRKLAPDTNILEGYRVVDNGAIILSSGVAAGIDMSLHVVARLLGPAQARETAHYMEYPWDENEVRKATFPGASKAAQH